jgi:hypothetical protein
MRTAARVGAVAVRAKHARPLCSPSLGSRDGVREGVSTQGGAPAGRHVRGAGASKWRSKRAFRSTEPTASVTGPRPRAFAVVAHRTGCARTFRTLLPALGARLGSAAATAGDVASVGACDRRDAIGCDRRFMAPVNVAATDKSGHHVRPSRPTLTTDRRADRRVRPFTATVHRHGGRRGRR